MSVLIMGLKMQKEETLKIAIRDGTASVYLDEGKADYYSVIELPDHGDLIDRDALMTRLGMAMDCDGCPNRTAVYFCGLPREVMEVCDELEKAPAVIPAERSEE